MEKEAIIVKDSSPVKFAAYNGRADGKARSPSKSSICEDENSIKMRDLAESPERLFVCLFVLLLNKLNSGFPGLAT